VRCYECQIFKSWLESTAPQAILASNLLLNPPPSRNTNAYASAPASEEITNAVPASTLVLESSANPTIASKPIISIQPSKNVRYSTSTPIQHFVVGWIQESDRVSKTVECSIYMLYSSNKSLSRPSIAPVDGSVSFGVSYRATHPR
jgi:hypothetical protein